ncbi:MAG: DegT/DnrJ/EryC1/StrS family aminotransferase [Planctomycetota bacterium]
MSSGSSPSAAEIAQTPVPFIDLKAQYKTIKAEIDAAVAEVFESQYFVLGPNVTGLEEEIAAYTGATHAIGCASGTDALILALQALDIGPGDEVITSPFTFFASGSSIHRVGATPVFVDIEPDGFNIDPEKIEAAITERTKAIMPVHIFGQTAEMGPILAIAEKHGLHVVEDAAQAIGATHAESGAGTLGTIGCFSFFPTKNLGGAGDGGVITTDDPELAKRMGKLRVHGDVGGYNHVEVGMNSRLDALQAAVLRVKLRHLDAWSDKRAANADRYRELIADIGLDGDVITPPVLPQRRHIYNQFVLRVPGRRDELLQGLRARGIGCAIYYPTGLHLQKCFADLGYAEGDMPETERACRDVLALPIFAELTDEHLRTVVAGIADVMHASGGIRNAA